MMVGIRKSNRVGNPLDEDVDADQHSISNLDQLDADALEADDQTINNSLTVGGTTTTDLADVGVSEDKLRYLGAYYTETFGESDIKTSVNSTDKSGGFISLPQGAGVFPDDFEDGVDPSWSGDTASLSVTQSPSLRGSQSGQLSATNASNIVDSPSLGGVTENAGFILQIDNDQNPAGDRIVFGPKDSNDTRIGGLNFYDDNSIEWAGSTAVDTGETWTAGTSLTVEFDWDFPNDQFDIIIDGTNTGTYNFANSVSSWDYMLCRVDTNDSGATRTVTFDNLPHITTGDVLIRNTNGIPDNLDTYEKAFFGTSPDGETVTVDVEDSNQNVLKSNISDGVDLSDIDSSKEVRFRVNLNRSDTSNNPTFDYLEWWWLRNRLTGGN